MDEMDDIDLYGLKPRKCAVPHPDYPLFQVF